MGFTQAGVVAMMMMATQRPEGLRQWFKENSILATLLLSEAITALTWGIHTEIQNDQNTYDLSYVKQELNALKLDQQRQDASIARIDERGTRAIPELQQRMKNHEDAIAALQKGEENLYSKYGTVPQVIQVQLDALKEQQLRIIYALDNTYNILNEHLRGHDPVKNIPLPQLDLKKPDKSGQPNK